MVALDAVLAAPRPEQPCQAALRLGDAGEGLGEEAGFGLINNFDSDDACNLGIESGADLFESSLVPIGGARWRCRSCRCSRPSHRRRGEGPPRRPR